MKPFELGKKYDKIAHWWNGQHDRSKYGVSQVQKALGFCDKYENALDVGCGAGGRFVRMMEDAGLSVCGIDISEEMIKIASAKHSGSSFEVADICEWQSDKKFDFIVAWDSIFHLPLDKQEATIKKLSGMLSVDGVLIYTIGDAVGEHTDSWMDDIFYYSSLGITENLRILSDNGVECKHLELDQFPQKHVYIVGKKIR